MATSDRPSCIVHWTEIERAKPGGYEGDDEPFTLGAAFGRHFGLKALGIHHERLLPGRRTSYPHAESAEEEFVYVLEGTPEVWLDGTLHRLKPGDGVGFPAGTGLSHSFLNNTEFDVRLLVVGQTTRPENRVFYPRNPERKKAIPDWWDDAPQRPLGKHDGLTDKRRAQKAKRSTP
jgi:uncharacterized cupin superfamily protein